MARGKARRAPKDRSTKQKRDVHCGGFCGDTHLVCPECLDWGELKRSEAERRSKPDNTLTPYHLEQ